MNLKIIIAWSFCWVINSINASFVLSDQDFVSTKKSNKNMISASVQKNPLPSMQLSEQAEQLPTKVIKATNFKLLGSLKTDPLVSQEDDTKGIDMMDQAKDSALVVSSNSDLTKAKNMPFTPSNIDLKDQETSSQDTTTSDDTYSIAQHMQSEKKESVQNHSKPAETQVKEPGVLYQNANLIADPATVAFNFEEANLANLISYMETVHAIKFISEDIIPTAKDIKGVAGHKITFRTNRNLTRKESWDLCISFLHIAGLDVVPMPQEGFYRLVPLTKANNEPIPTYIGVDLDVLPDSDMIVRYVFFVRNIDPAKIQPILKNMQSSSAKLDVYAELKGLIFTDRANSIKSLMKIVLQLDHAALPEVLSVVKLKRASADDVINLYQSLKPASAGAGQPQRVWANTQKEASIDYFPQDVIMVSDKRTNSLILLGTAKDVARIEEFITKHVDISPDRDIPPLFTYRLQYTNAKDMQDLLAKIVSYGANTTAGQYGGVRDGIKFFQKMSIVADSWTNSLIINATPEDYQALKPLIEELDVAQKQVGLEVLIVQVKDVDVKTLGAQISGPNGQGSVVQGAGLFGPTFLPGVSAQTSGVPQGSPVVVTNATNNPASDDFSIKSSLGVLLGNNLVNEVGSILVTFGKPIWALFKILKSITSTHIIANPFVVVSNNSTAVITSGEQRRQISGEVISSASVRATGLQPVDANLTVTITPTINKGNIINMNINVENSKFTQALLTVNDNSPRDTKQVQTVASVANGETLVLGGIMIENYASSATGVPFLEHIPVFGWFFKSKTRTVSRDHFLIFICPRLLDPVRDGKEVDVYTNYKLLEAQKSIDLIDDTDWFASGKDPVQRAFFGTKDSSHVLQDLKTGNQFAQRMAIDGKIDKKVIARREKMVRQKNSKLAAQQHKKNKKIEKANYSQNKETESRMKNAISSSMKPDKGASYVA